MSGFLLLFNSAPDFTVAATGSGHGSASSSATVTGIPTSGVNLIAISCVYVGGGSSITDGSGNAYSATLGYSASGINTKVFYCPNPTTTSSMTFNFNGSFSSIAVVVLKGTSTPTPAFDQKNGTNTSGTSLSSGSITPSANNTFVIACAGTGAGSTGTPPAVSGYNLINVPFSSGNYQGLVTYYQIQTAATTTSVTFAGTNINYYSATITNFTS